jgi:polysaccharide deacetylase 2 family uncharacterized protein YibQ
MMRFLPKLNLPLCVFLLSLFGACGAIYWDFKKNNISIEKNFSFKYLPQWDGPAKPFHERTEEPENILSQDFSKKMTKALEKYYQSNSLNMKTIKAIYLGEVDRRPVVSIILTYADGNQAAWSGLLSALPPTIGLAFYGNHAQLSDNIKKAKANGFECFKMIPMEPIDFPLDDPGFNTLLTGLKSADNISRLKSHIEFDGIGDSIDGITTFFGSLFTTSSWDMGNIVRYAKAQNLFIVDLNSAPRSQIESLCNSLDANCAKSHIQLDNILSESGITAELNELEKDSRDFGHAFAFAVASPIIVKKLSTWIQGLDKKGIRLVSVKSYINKTSK